MDDTVSPRPSGSSGPRLISIEHIDAGKGNDVVDLTSEQFTYGDVTIDGGQGNDVLWSNAGDDLLFGGDGDDTLSGGAGIDALYGESSDDEIYGDNGNDYLDGGSKDDFLDGGAGNDFIAGASGDDELVINAGEDIVAYNQGDGEDTLEIGDDVEQLTLSLGGGIGLSDISLERKGDDLIIEIEGEYGEYGEYGHHKKGKHGKHGSGEYGEYGDGELIIEDWFNSDDGGVNPVVTLQLILDASDEYDMNSTDPLFNKRVQSFDFNELVSQFEEANSNKKSRHWKSWSAMHGYLDSHIGGSDDEAIGGEVSYQFAHRNGDMTLDESLIQQTLADNGFGSTAQSIAPIG